MSGLETGMIDAAWHFVLVLARLGGLVATAPLFSSTAIPVRIKALLAVVLAAVLTPLYLDIAIPPAATLTEIGVQMGIEILVGVALGGGLMIVLSGVQLAGQMVGQMSGMALTEGADPGFQGNSSVFGQVYFLVTMALFVALGGHREMIEALLRTFDHAPPGHAVLSSLLAERLLGLITVGFELGLRTAAPLVMALFLATLILGLISRTLPQINTIVVGFGVNGLLTLGMMMASLGAVAWAYQGPLTETLATLSEATAPAPPSSLPQ